jgi:DNA-binding response OmpR family regulator
MSNPIAAVPRPRILILESEYLVALDAERILREAFPCDVTIGQTEAGQVVHGDETYDVALLDVGPSLLHAFRSARRLCRGGVGVIFTCAGRFGTAFKLRKNMVVITKPYDEQTLLAAVRAKL